jgi:gluconolactonase
MRHLSKPLHAVVTVLATLGMAPVAGAQDAPPGAARPVVTPHIDKMDPELDAVVDSSQTVERVATGFVFTEGPMWYKGRLIFSDVRDDKMYAVTPEGKVELLNGESGGLAQHPPHVDVGSNGSAPTPGAVGVVARMGARDIARMDAPGQMKPYITHFEGKRLNSPNDVVYAPDGALWFTDPPFGLLYLKEGAKAAQELPFAGVFRYANGKLTAPITDMTLPNGIGFSPDGKTLYVDNFGPEGYLRAYDLGANGKLSNMREIIRFPGRQGPDGLKIDMEGNIWMTGPGGIRIITPHGKVLGQIKLPETAANLAFADDGHTLYITGSTSIYRLHTKVAGEMPRYHQR